ncbi:MAG: rhombosortase [Alteromonadaceae bacterium]|nr:rhombosortase [Alteromonadaceae bacterium]MBH85034.1 rhombosortase [Alteromonadaceae bacterium]|tara:strand:- start:7766 stop:8359 length:594 start_codon:yes stop_codon:yes gene_type:complete
MLLTTLVPRRYWILAVTLLAAWTLPGALLEWSRAGIVEGEYWRLLTGHWTHVGLAHLLLNLLGLMVIGALFSHREGIWQWLLALIVIALGVSLSLLWLMNDLDWYRGFSGCLYGLLAYRGVVSLTDRPGFAATVLVFTGLKLLADSVMTGDGLSADWIGAAVIWQAHITGAVTGAVVGVLCLAGGHLLSRRRPSAAD